MYKLKNKQLIHLKKGKHHDGGGLYIRITKQGKGLWTYRFRINKKYSKNIGIKTTLVSYTSTNLKMVVSFYEQIIDRIS